MSNYLTINPSALSAAYQISAQTGIAPNLLLGQFMAENGQGLTGTGAQQNNFANLMPGGQLATYATPGAFASAYTSTIQNNFPGALGAGTNASAFGNALANGRNGMQFQQGITPQQYTNNISSLSQLAISPNAPVSPLTSASTLAGYASSGVKSASKAVSSTVSSAVSAPVTTITGWLQKEGANIAFIAFGIVLVIFALKENGMVKIPTSLPLE